MSTTHERDTSRLRSRPRARLPGPSATLLRRRSRATARARSTSSPRAPSPRANCTWATSATTRSATPTRAFAAPAAMTSSSASASTPSACPPRWRRSSARSRRPTGSRAAASGCSSRCARLGFSFDYERVFYSSDEAQYRWSQWLFVTLLEAGLIYRDDTTVDWCDHCRTTLAALQVEDGTLLALPQRGAPDPPPDLVPAHHALPGGERRPPARAGGRLGRDLALHPALHPRPQRWGGGRPRRRRMALAHRLHAAPRRGRRRRASSCSRRATPRSRPGRPSRPCRAARRAALGRLGAQRPRRQVGAAGRHRRLGERRPGAGRELPRARLAAGRRPLRADRRAGDSGGRRGRRGARRAGAAAGRSRPTRRGGRLWRAEPRPGRRCATAPPTSRSRASASGARRSRSSTARAAARCRCPSRTCRSCCRATSSRPARATRWPSVPTFVDVACPRCGEPAKRETDTLDCHFDALWLWVPSAVPPEARAEQMFTHPDLQRWLPSERLVAGADSRRLRLRPARRHQGPARHRPVRVHGARRALQRLPLPRDGDRRRAQDEQAPRQRRRPRRAGRAIRRRHGPPRRALRRRPGQDAELERRRPALRRAASSTTSGSTPRRASPASRPRPRTPRPRPTPSSCASACCKWCDNGLEPHHRRTWRSCRCTRRCAT